MVRSLKEADKMAMKRMSNHRMMVYSGRCVLEKEKNALGLQLKY